MKKKQRNADDKLEIKEARQLLGNEAANMTDEQVQELIYQMTGLADIIIDHILSMSPQERKEFNKKYAQSSSQQSPPQKVQPTEPSVEPPPEFPPL